jgi:hypothetical protein
MRVHEGNKGSTYLGSLPLRRSSVEWCQNNKIKRFLASDYYPIYGQKLKKIFGKRVEPVS